MAGKNKIRKTKNPGLLNRGKLKIDYNQNVRIETTIKIMNVLN